MSDEPTKPDGATPPGTQLTLAGTGTIVSADEFFGENRQKLFTSFDVKTEDGKVAVMVYTQGGMAIPLADMLNTEFNIRDVLLHVVQMEDEKTGDMINGIRTVLIDDDGQGYAATSAGVVKSLQFLMGLWGPPPFNPPRRVKVVSASTRKKFRVFNIVPVSTAKVVEPEPPQKRAK